MTRSPTTSTPRSARRARFLRQILDGMQEQIAAGIPLVVLESSCGAVFRDELRNMLPNDEDAVRLSRQTYLLSEFLEPRAPEFHPPQLRRQAIVQGHCHHKAVFKLTDERKLLERLGLDAEFLNAGCCGMAGSCGFEAGDKYDVSIRAGARAAAQGALGPQGDDRAGRWVLLPRADRLGDRPPRAASRPGDRARGGRGATIRIGLPGA